MSGTDTTPGAVRRKSVFAIPGPKDSFHATLQTVCRHVKQTSPEKAALLAWLADNVRTGEGAAPAESFRKDTIGFLCSVGWIVKRDGRYQCDAPTTEVRSADQVVERLHSKRLFIAELLEAARSEKTPRELFDIANSQYGMAWTKRNRSQITARTSWLLSTKMLRNAGTDARPKWQTTRRGEQLCQRIDSQHSRTTPARQPTVPAPRRKQDLNQLAEKLLIPVEQLELMRDLLADKNQVLMQGPPGTGKTYVARELARCLAGSATRVWLVQFHPSYAYEDFVQGFRPTLVNDQPAFKLHEGPLVRAAKKARDTPAEKHFIVIDEINRGNLAKVFGELYFLLEYRDEKMTLQYADEPFALPRNLYIIGTMNTADRSIALVDLALRRRFHFVDFRPDRPIIRGLLRRWMQKTKQPEMTWVADVVDLANKRLADQDAAIGPSHFMKDSLDEQQVQMVWEHTVLPYIEERLYGDHDQLSKFELSALRKAAAEDSPDAAD